MIKLLSTYNFFLTESNQKKSSVWNDSNIGEKNKWTFFLISFQKNFTREKSMKISRLANKLLVRRKEIDKMFSFTGKNFVLSFFSPNKKWRKVTMFQFKKFTTKFWKFFVATEHCSWLQKRKEFFGNQKHLRCDSTKPQNCRHVVFF